MTASSENTVMLPEFVCKQAQQSLERFLARRRGVILTGQLYKTAVIVQQITPHPLTRESVTLPIALLNWHEDRWRLYFRGTRGRWLRVPDSPEISRPDPLLEAVDDDQLGIFWRQ
ncbi:DUF3024 domain-containing protein [Saccharospirillum mangrovi]|uniref:DUF3024 domain-containing protein n=1 Tax=Saccharospirillum mangrovi TaxID=2161747 RepID=UPI0013002DAE|nr:DUF3024 domain-containing protein [Saccharospirillum mangrovi]